MGPILNLTPETQSAPKKPISYESHNKQTRTIGNRGTASNLRVNDVNVPRGDAPSVSPL